MKPQENDFFIDKAYSKYQTLAKKEKAMINLSFIILSVVFAISSIYMAGESFGEFLYYVNN